MGLTSSIRLALARRCAVGALGSGDVGDTSANLDVAADVADERHVTRPARHLDRSRGSAGYWSL
jgi:hypothetical protein